MVINEGLRSKTSKSGRTRFSIRIEAEPVFVQTDPKALGAPVAQAIAFHLREKMKAISATASPATIKARRIAEMAVQGGKAWAMKRYAGGRIGGRPPGQTDRLFNDSGRFADSIVAAGAKDGSWRINVAANRLDPQTANGGAAAIGRIWTRLVQLVPAFGDVRVLMNESDIVRARVKTQQAMISKGKKTEGKASAWDLAKAAAQTARALFDVARSAVG